MHLAGEIVDEAVEGEKRWIGDEGAETRLTSAIDRCCITMRYIEGSVVNDSKGDGATFRHSQRTEYESKDDNHPHCCKLMKQNLANREEFLRQKN